MVPAQKQLPLIPGDSDYIATLTLAYLRKKKAVLVFCPTKNDCQKTAKFIADKLPVQFAEYKKIPAVKPKSPNEKSRRSSAAPKLDFSDLVTELKDIVCQVVEVKSKGKNYSRDAV